jgi:hypothetical protein
MSHIWYNDKLALSRRRLRTTFAVCMNVVTISASIVVTSQQRTKITAVRRSDPTRDTAH